jgi:hypothetical protein
VSTYWYFQCLDHTPPLTSEDEFTQHTDDAAFHRGVKLAASRPLPTEDELDDLGLHLSDDYFSRNARRFLLAHPACSLGLLNEQGDRRALDAAPKETPA